MIGTRQVIWSTHRYRLAPTTIMDFSFPHNSVVEGSMVVVQFDDGMTRSLMEIPAGTLSITSDDLDIGGENETTDNPGASIDFVDVRVPCVRYIANTRYTATDMKEWLVSLKSKMGRELHPCLLHVVAQYASTAYLGEFLKRVNACIQRTYKQLLKTPEGDAKTVLADVLKAYGEAFQLLLGSHQLLMDPQTKQSMAFIATAMLIDRRGKPSWFTDYLENMFCTKLRWTTIVQLLGERIHHTTRKLDARDLELADANDHKSRLVNDVADLKERAATFDAKWDTQRRKLKGYKKKIVDNASVQTELSQALERLTLSDGTHATLREQLEDAERRVAQYQHENVVLCQQLDDAATQHKSDKATLSKQLEDTEHHVDSLLLDKEDAERRAVQAEVDWQALHQQLDRSTSRTALLERRVRYYKKRFRGNM